MGLTTSIALFIGVLLYDGNTENTKKGMIATLSYGSMLLFTTFVRILPMAIEQNFVFKNAQPLAGIATIIFITVFWVIGVVLGVNIFRIKKFRE